MAKSRYVLVLSGSIAEGNTYAKRAGLERWSYRAIGARKQVRNTQVADVHILPSFHKRLDKHAILSELKWGRDIVYVDVEMPEPLEAPAVDQGDGMGEQLTIDDIFEKNRVVSRVDIFAGMAEEEDEIEVTLEKPIPPTEFKVVAVPDEDYDPPQSHRDMVAKVLPHKDPYPLPFKAPTPILDSYKAGEMF